MHCIDKLVRGNTRPEQLLAALTSFGSTCNSPARVAICTKTR